MRIERRISRIVRTPTPEPGFMGEGHTAVTVVDPTEFARNDPFILLMDDRIDRPAGPLGGPHPHAGFETVTLLLEGTVDDRDEGTMNAGDALWMTAGSGVIHNEEMKSRGGKVRLLQLWLTLAKGERWAEPRFERIAAAGAPVRREGGAELRLLSGASGGVASPTRNHVPVTLAEIKLDVGATIEQDLPAEYNGFVYVIEGSVRIGADRPKLVAGQVGWLDRPEATGASVVRISAGEAPARVVLYAGLPTGDPIVVQGPFVGDAKSDITRKYREYLAGDFPRMSQLAETHAAA